MTNFTRKPEILTVKNNLGYVSVNGVPMLLKNSIFMASAIFYTLNVLLRGFFAHNTGKLFLQKTAYRTATPQRGIKPYAISRIIQKIFNKKTFLFHGHISSIAPHGPTRIGRLPSNFQTSPNAGRIAE